MNTQTEKKITIMDATEAFAVPGEDHFIDVINPITHRSWIQNENLDEIRLRYPTAEIVNIDAFLKAKAALQDVTVKWLDCTEERYHEMLNLLPPARWICDGFLVGEPWDHHATTGQPRFAAFVNPTPGHYQESDRPLTIREFEAMYR